MIQKRIETISAKRVKSKRQRESLKSRKPKRRKAAKPKRQAILSNLATQAKTPKRAIPKDAQAEATLKLVLSRLEDAKATDTLTIDLYGKSTLADYMVVASGRSHRHVSAIADQLTEALHKNGAKRVKVEGLPHCDWVLVDAGDVIVHVFRPEVREFYNLEKMWTRTRSEEN